MALHEGMLIHVEIMDWGIQNDLYTIQGLDDPNVVSGYVNMNMMRKIDLLRAYANSWYVSAIEEVLNQVYQTKDSWLAIVLHKTGWGRIVTSFPSIL